MERLEVPSPLGDSDDAPPKIANKIGPTTYRNSIPITPVDSEHLSPYYPHIQIPLVNPQTPPATIGTPSAYQQSDFDSEGGAHYSPSADGDDAGTSPRPGSRGNLAPPSRRSSWGIATKQSDPSLSHDTVDFGTDITSLDPSQTRNRSISASSITSLTSLPLPLGNNSIESSKKGKSTDLDSRSSRVDILDRIRSLFTYSASTDPNRRLTIDTGGHISSHDTTVSPLLPFPQITVSDWGKGDNTTPSNALVLTPSTIEIDHGIYSQQNDDSTKVANRPLGKGLQTADPQSDNDLRTLATCHEPGMALRSIDEVMSVDDLSQDQKSQPRNKEIQEWLSSASHTDYPDVAVRSTYYSDDNVPSKDIPLESNTKNLVIPGHLYYNLDGHDNMDQDLGFLRKSRSWSDPPTFPAISQPGTKPLQPPSSQAAIDLFEKMCHETGSVISNEASCGTRRWSLPSSDCSHKLEKGDFLFEKTTTRGPLSDVSKGDARAYKMSLHGLNENNDIPESELETPSPKGAKFPEFVDIGIQVDIQVDFASINASKSTFAEQPSEQHNLTNSTENQENVTTADDQLETRQSRRQFKQVGLARVQLEVMYLSQYQPESESEEFDLVREENSHGNDSNSANHRSVDESSEDHSGSSHMNSNGRNRKRREEDREDDGNSNKRPCRRPSGPQQKMKLPRLACPYQAYEKLQSCLRPGRSNPEGGCAGISRLKQHLSRRHMVSFRCQRCWKSFDTKNNARNHKVQSPLCDARDKPWDERFMTPEQEVEIEHTCRHKGEEDAWWGLFRLFIPGMQSRNFQSLATEYSPYISDAARDNISNFDISTYTTFPTVDSVELANAYIPPSDSATASATFAIPSIAPSNLGFSMPLLEFASGPGEDFDLNFFNSSSSSNNATRMSSLDNATSPPIISSNMAPTPLTSAPTPVFAPHRPPDRSSSIESSAVVSQMQRRNYERLKARNQQVQRDNAELREVNRENCSDIDRVDAIVEEMLALDELDVSVFERLSQVSEILSCVRGRMQ